MKELDSKKTGLKIRKLMDERGIGVSRLALFMGINNMSVYQWFYGHSLPSTANLVKLSGLLNCKVDEILVTKEGE